MVIADSFLSCDWQVYQLSLGMLFKVSFLPKNTNRKNTNLNNSENESLTKNVKEKRK